MTLPEGYQVVDVGGARAYTAVAAAEWVHRTLEGGETLYGWAAKAEGGRAMAGRGRVFSVPAPTPGPEGHERWVVRHYHRGGAMAPTLGDRYLALGQNRPLHELVVSEEARRRGVPTPAVVAGVKYPHGLFFRADLVTEEIPDSADLAAVLFGRTRPELTPVASLRAVGGLIRTLADAGVHHRDFHAKNVVLAGEGDAVKAHLVDLDRCRPLNREARVRPMRRRMERSLRKFEAKTARLLTQEEWEALDQAVGRAG